MWVMCKYFTILYECSAAMEFFPWKIAFDPQLFEITGAEPGNMELSG